MSSAIISVENLGKRYRISHQQQGGMRYKSLRDVIMQKMTAPFQLLKRGLSSPAAGASHLPSPAHAPAPLPSSISNLPSSKKNEDFWALRNVSFEVKQGEVVGIIGRNGAGKSTLLKILSRITEPTEGRVHIKGRVASLLEVGTGFHPELTGRENIFLNGAILGMHRVEIKKKFDEIVAFAEVEKFLDTPVKRYSSGMYVRLAFAVAAHLEPEILIVDEVLAVGDAEFQKKCLGKMQSVSRNEGRTVLFVSHNFAAISSLTQKAVVLDHGRVEFNGTTEKGIQFYYELSKPKLRRANNEHHASILDVSLIKENKESTNQYSVKDLFRVSFEFETDGSAGMSIDLFLCDNQGTRLAFWSTAHFHDVSLPTAPGHYRCDVDFPPQYLAAGTYWLDISTAFTNIKHDHVVERGCIFEVLPYNPNHSTWHFQESYNYGRFALFPNGMPRMLKISG